MHGKNAQQRNHNHEGLEYWKSRLHRFGEDPGRYTKVRTHRKERRVGRRILRETTTEY